MDRDLEVAGFAGVQRESTLENRGIHAAATMATDFEIRRPEHDEGRAKQWAGEKLTMQSLQPRMILHRRGSPYQLRLAEARFSSRCAIDFMPTSAADSGSDWVNAIALLASELNPGNAECTCSGKP